MNLVMIDNSLVVCAESCDDMRYKIWNFNSHVITEFNMSHCEAVCEMLTTMSQKNRTA